MRTAAVVAPGLMVLAIIMFMGKVSGAHLNPAVSVAFSLRGDFRWRRVPGYIVVQLIGASLAAPFLHEVIKVSPKFGSNYVASRSRYSRKWSGLFRDPSSNAANGTMSRNGASGRSVDSGSHAPQKTRTPSPHPSTNVRARLVLPTPASPPSSTSPVVHGEPRFGPGLVKCIRRVLPA
jgi:hypothetical protein